MTPTETVTKIASTAVDSLKGSPVMLGLLLMNIIFMSLIFVTVRDLRKQQHEQMSLVLQRCVPMVTPHA
jgi:hypothetical protein